MGIILGILRLLGILGILGNSRKIFEHKTYDKTVIKFFCSLIYT